MRTNQLCAFARQICEALGVKFEPSIDMASGYRTHELKRGHQCSFWANYSTPDGEDPALGSVAFPRTASARGAGVVSADLALSFGKPLPLGNFLSRLGSGTTTDCFAVPIPNFGLIGTRPKHQFFHPSPAGARRSYFGHKHSLAFACDGKAAVSTRPIGAGRSDAAASAGLTLCVRAGRSDVHLLP